MDDSSHSSRLVRRKKLLSSINIVPYVDVMLVLLVILMVTAPMVSRGQIDLPAVRLSTVASLDPLEVTIRFNGALSLREKGQSERMGLTLATLQQVLKESQRKHPNRPVVISADSKVEYGRVLDVLDRLRSHGIGQVGLSVRPLPS